MPSEYFATRSSARSASPTRAIAAETAVGPMPWMRPSTARLRRPDRWGNERGTLDDRPDPRHHGVQRRSGLDAEHRCPSPGRAHEPEQHADRRRLAGPVRPEEPEHAALGHRQVEAADRDLLAVGLPEAFGLDHCPHRTGTIPSGYRRTDGHDGRPAGHRRRAGGHRGSHHRRRRRSRGRGRRPRHVPAGQDLRRRPHHGRAARARGARRAARPRSARRRHGSTTSCWSRRPAGSITVPLPRRGEHARVMRRVDLDAALVERAAAAGAELRLGAALTELKSLPGGVEATLADGTRRHRAVRGRRRRPLLHRPSAARRPTRRRCGASGRRSGSTSPASTTRACGCCSNATCSRATPGCSRCPDGRANVGFGMLRDGHRHRARCWRAPGATCSTRPVLRDILGPRAEPEAPHRAWPIPSHLDPNAARRTTACCSPATPPAWSTR